MNGDLISRSALLEQECFMDDDNGFRCSVVLSTDVRRAPAVDAETFCGQMGLVKEAFEMAKSSLVPVVRCKDCKWLYNGLDMYCCTKHTGLALIPPDGSGFCSYGERRVDDAD